MEAGWAGTDANARTAQRANAFAAEAARLGVRVICSQQVLDMDRLTARQRRWEVGSRLCVAGSDGAELFVSPPPGARVGGVELQCCVLYAVLGTEERGFHYRGAGKGFP